jgi:hypothetical protein
MSPVMSEPRVVGVKPWLPWPLSQWRWWTEPVRAERLAALRIGLALVLLIDLLTSYLPRLHDLFGLDSLTRLGDRDLFDWYIRAPKWNWSLLRGLGHPFNLGFALAAWVAATVWALLGLKARRGTPGDSPSGANLRLAVVCWTVATLMGQLGLWARVLTVPKVVFDRAPAVIVFLEVGSALIAWGLASVFLLLGCWPRSKETRPAPDRLLVTLLLLAWVVATALLLLGWWRLQQDAINPAHPLSLARVLGAWDEDAGALDVALGVWIGATVCLLLGVATRLSAVVVWVLSTSFANLNTYVDNAGDTIRGILLFYLMLCPSGAAWSVDSWLVRRKRQGTGPAHVYPWVLRLVFLQMVFIYWMNGLYKLFGDEWRQGNSLYYVLADLTLTRVSFAEFQPPFLLLQVTAWTVLTWEVSFPLLVALPWTRTIALFFGAAFHVGIWVSMELGGFAPYALCMYLPLLPWERWLGRRREPGPV